MATTNGVASLQPFDTVRATNAATLGPGLPALRRSAPQKIKSDAGSIRCLTPDGCHRGKESRGTLPGLESQKRAAHAWSEGYFSGSVAPVRDINGLVILDRDEHLRPDTDMRSLGALTPAFRDMGETMPGFDAVAILKYPHLERIDHVHHAGNSSGIVDGAAAVLVGSKAFGETHGLTPRARIRATAKIGTDPTIMLTGPVPATGKILRESGMEVGDIDLFEVNEAFSAVVLRFLQATGADPSRVNVNGGAIAMGHPLGATGAMILGTALDELERSGKGTALATLCVASGMGAATIIERI